MSLTLQKSQSLSLTKTAPQLENVRIGLGWDVRTTSGQEFDLDASAILLVNDPSTEFGYRIRSTDDFVFYNQLGDVTLPGAPQYDPERASVKHTGDNRTGVGDGDDETIIVHLNKVPADVDRIMFVVSIHEARQRRQNFGQVSNAYARLVNDDTGEELAVYDLAENASSSIGLKFVSLDREAGGWKFTAVSESSTKDFGDLLKEFGIYI